MITLFSDTHYIQHANVDNRSYSEFVQVFDEAMFSPLPAPAKLALRRMIRLLQPQEWNVKPLEGMIFDKNTWFAGNLFEFFTLTFPEPITPTSITVHRDDLQAIAPLLQSLQTLAIAYHQRRLWLSGLQNNWSRWTVCFDDTKPDVMLDKSKLYLSGTTLITKQFSLLDVLKAAKKINGGTFRVRCEEKQVIVSDEKQLQSEQLTLTKPVEQSCEFMASLKTLHWPIVGAQRVQLFVNEIDGKLVSLTTSWKVEDVEFRYSFAPKVLKKQEKRCCIFHTIHHLTNTALKLLCQLHHVINNCTIN